MAAFVRGRRYTRAEVAELVDLPLHRRTGGNWNTGYDSWSGKVFVFCNVGTAGRTGHDYANKWIGNELEWYGKTGSHRSQRLIGQMVTGDTEVHVFWRVKDSDPFTYAGVGRAMDVSDDVPVRLRWNFDQEPTKA